jgi:murein DD-endopeptidase MepM/ murein hydrolase activator NlpD
VQIIITHGTLARSRVLHLTRRRLAAVLCGLLVVLALIGAAAARLVLATTAADGWSSAAKFTGPTADDPLQRDRFLRANLDAMASRVGEMQAKLLKLDAMSERITGLAGLKLDDTTTANRKVAGSQGGPFVPASVATLEQLDQLIRDLDRSSDSSSDRFTYIESRLTESRLQALMIPTSRPVRGPIGSGFGVRADPFSGHAALHTGLDFPSDSGTPIWAAAGGVVLSSQEHPAYGKLLDIDHGDNVVTRYAHTSKILVKPGDLVRRGQRIAEVGTSGRSTGPHLHFEVLVGGTPQDPAKFLAGTPGMAEHLALHKRSSRPRR